MSLQGTSALLTSSEQCFLFRRLHFSEMRSADSGAESCLFSSSEQPFTLSIIWMDFLRLPRSVLFCSSWAGKHFFCSTFTCAKEMIVHQDCSSVAFSFCRSLCKRTPHMRIHSCSDLKSCHVVDHQEGLCKPMDPSLRTTGSGPGPYFQSKIPSSHNTQQNKHTYPSVAVLSAFI